MTDTKISPDRYPLGFAAAMLAPAAVAFPIGAAEGSLPVALFASFAALVVAGLHVGILALPIFALLRRWWPPAWWLVLPASFLIGAAPASLLEGPSAPLRERLDVGLAFGGFGLSGGIAFWLVVNRPWRRGSCR